MPSHHKGGFLELCESGRGKKTSTPSGRNIQHPKLLSSSRSLSKPVDLSSVLDYPTSCLVEQLTLLEQVLQTAFQNQISFSIYINNTILSRYLTYCIATTHFPYDHLAITQAVYHFSSTTYIYNFEIACYIMIVVVLEIIYIYQSYRFLIKFIILNCILLQYCKQ